jgi:hypothetical protein
MGLKEELEAERGDRMTRCVVGRFIDTMDKADAEQIEQIFDDHSYPVELVRRVMMKRGFIGGTTVTNRHARRECVCRLNKN